MAEIFKFFNSAPGDERWHYASDFADYFGSVLTSGLLYENGSYGLQVTVNSGTLTTKVAIGKALIKGYSYENTNDLTLTHSLPEQALDRIDRIVLRLDLRNANRFIKAFVKEGVSATNPIAPDLQRDNYVYELSLATVRVRANTSSISVNDITDTRALESVCGIVQSLITVPTSVFQQQFDVWFDGIADTTEQSVQNWQTTQEQAFSDWFATIQNTLDGDIATNLANQITTHKNNNSHVHWLGTIAGGNSLTATNNEISSYTEGLGISFKTTTTSTSGTTLNVNNLGAVPIIKANGNPVTNLKANGVYTLRYSGGNFTLQGEGGEYGTAAASDVLAGKTFGTENGVVEGTATIASLGGKKWARGGKAGNGTSTNVISTNVNFTIRIIILNWSSSGYSYRMMWDKNNNPSRSSWYLGDHITYATPEGITGSSQYPNAITVSGNTISLSCGFVGSATVYWEVFE